MLLRASRALSQTASLAALVWVCSDCPIALAQLDQRQVAVIAAAGNSRSEELARYYASQRGIPDSQVVAIEFPVGPAGSDSIEWDQWQAQVRPAIRRSLEEAGLRDTIRCVVTVWGVPLRVGSPGRDDEPMTAFVRSELETRHKQMQTILDWLDELVKECESTEHSPPVSEQPADRPNSAAGAFNRSADVRDWRQELGLAGERAQRAIVRASSRAGNEQVREWDQRLSELLLLAGGAELMDFIISSNSGSGVSSEMKEQLIRVQERMSVLVESLGLVEMMPAGLEREAMRLGLLQKLAGVLGVIGWLDNVHAQIEAGGPARALDSELARLWDDHPAPAFFPDTNWRNDLYSDFQFARQRSTLMVARIDAPTAEIAKRMIDDALAAEQAGGISGRTCLDLRGLAVESGQPVSGELAIEQSLRRMVERLRAGAAGGSSVTDLTVNEVAALFGPGECGDVSVYCGGYSLARYVDAFDWQRGGIGYHLSTLEAADLHDPAGTGWCRSMLADGACATIGAVGDCDWSVLPDPDLFWQRLLVERKTLAEAYWLTVPNTGWQVILIGDPLYRPAGMAR